MYGYIKLGKQTYEIIKTTGYGVDLRNVITGNMKYGFPYRDFNLCKTKKDGFTRPDSVMANGGYLHWKHNRG